MKRIGLALCFVVAGGSLVLGQRWRYGEGQSPEAETCRTAREVPSHSTGTPTWTNEAGFEKDVFTFVRVRRDRLYGYRRFGPGDWSTDFPDSDLNLSFRLQQVTSMKVDPDGRVLRLTDPDLSDYPWIYMVEPGSLSLREPEVDALRKYLTNGGVLMADDFWGQVEWLNFERQIRRALPERSFEELPMTHPIFHCVFDLKGPISRLQTPNYMQGIRSQYDGVTWEENHEGGDCRDMKVLAIHDEKGRIMVLAVHNCDNGDGWEREGEDDYFFHEFAEKRAYPLGVNIIFYLMTH